MATTTTPNTPRGLQPPDKRPVRITVPEESKVRYGDPFFPKVPFQSIFYILAIFGVLIFLALTNPAPLQDPADPLNHALIDPRPEWYFMFLFQLLKYFQGPSFPSARWLSRPLSCCSCLACRFTTATGRGRSSRRPVAMVSMSAGMLTVMFLMWGGFGFPAPIVQHHQQRGRVGPPPVNAHRLVQERCGDDLHGALRCLPFERAGVRWLESRQTMPAW